MLFLNMALAAGLSAVVIPIILHLLNRKSSKSMDWGAMQFLVESLATRSRRIQLEEALLMACRCLLFALIALAMMRPFVPSTSFVPWVVVLPLGLIAVAAFGVSFSMWHHPKWRWRLLVGSLGALGLCVAFIGLEKYLDLKRFGNLGEQDVAIIIDASTSMTMEIDGVSNFDRARQEAREIIDSGGRATSYSIILAGPSPEALIDSPLNSRLELYDILDDLKPTRGAMQAFDALTLASLVLSRGYNPGKQIVVISDGQTLGWETESPSRWNFLDDAFDNLPSRPKLIVRNLPLPANFRNVSISDLTVSRKVVGIDRPVTINVTIENTGTEAVSPSSIELTVGGEVLSDNTIGQLVPGASETIRFSHQFREAGSYEVHARVVVDDELKEDDYYETALNVLGSLKVLIVDGNPSSRFIESASAFTALALAPGSANAAQVQTAAMKSNEFLVEPEVVAATEIKKISNLFAYHAVILADVPRLPESVAEELSLFVKRGGGLLVAPGRRVLPEFYGSWMGDEATPLMPAELKSEAVNVDDAGLAPAISSFNHPALKLVAVAERSDLSSTAVGAYWVLEPIANMDGAVNVAGNLNNGRPFMVERRWGRGHVIMLACSLDINGSNLATRQSFVPLIHELVYHLANPSGLQLNLEPGWELSIRLGGGSDSEDEDSNNGLRGEYFMKRGFRDRAGERIDRDVNFHWGDRPFRGLPPDNWSVRWTGSLRPRYSEEYEFEVHTQDTFNFWLDGVQIIKRRGKGSLPLNAGQLYDVRIEFEDRRGDAYAKLHWKSHSQPWEIVPNSQWLVQRGDFATMEKVLDLNALGPDGSRRMAELFRGPEGMIGKVSGKVMTGLYYLEIPADQKNSFSGMLDHEGRIPFTVKSNTAESQLMTWTPTDIEFMERYVSLLQPENSEQAAGILLGESFGEELWKYLAVSVLFLLLGEIALSRWIALQRRTGLEETVDFESMMHPGKAFDEQVVRLKKTRN